jgi:UDP-2,3-diacylglucosamine pyrophosphatase LpxH
MGRKLKLVISDFHLSRGKWLRDGRRNPLEDFHQDEKFREFLEHYSTGANAEADVELIVNGDFFDPLAVVPVPESGLDSRKLEFPIEVEEPAAVRKFQAIVAGHPVAIQAMRDFLGRGKRVVIRWGNHDAALLWPAVQAYLREALAPPRAERLEFQREPYVFDRICVDHGHQHETMHQFDEDNLFMRRRAADGREVMIQNLPFGSFFCLSFLNRMKIERSYINQVHPFGVYLKIAFLLNPLRSVRDSLRVAWFFVKMRFITHPMRFSRLRKTLKIMGEIFKRPSLEHEAERILTGPGAEGLPYDTLIMGHNHHAQQRIYPGGKQYINTGTWTPITSLDFSTLGHRVLRTYALIEYVDGRARASLKIWNGQPGVTEDFA